MNTYSLYLMLCLLLAGFSVETMAAQTVFYISPSGRDTWSGKLPEPNHAQTDGPFATLTRTRDAVRALKQVGPLRQPVNIQLRRGIYPLSEPFTLTTEDSGTSECPITYQAYPGEPVALSGGQPITGWTLHDKEKNIWQALAPGLKTRQLYVNGVRATRAHAGKGFQARYTLTKDGFSLNAPDTAMAGWKNPQDIEFVFRREVSRNAAWTEPRCGIQAIVGNQVTMKQPGWAMCTGRGWDMDVRGGPYDIENAYELLDQPGEWYLDRQAGMLYYIPMPGERMATARVIAPMLETLLSAAGTLDHPIHHIQFKGITFAHATFMRPSTEQGWPEGEACYMAWSRSRTALRTPGNVSVQAGRDLRFERCIFTHLGAVGLDIAGGSQNNIVIGCVFTDISANCIQLGSVDDPLRADQRTRDSGNQILNCYIHDAPCEFHGGCGIMAAYVSDTLISHNVICNTPLIGVNIGWGWGVRSYMENNRLTFNHISNNVSTLADGGCFKSLSPMANSTINNNYFHDVSGSQGCIYLDNGSSHFDVYRNVCQQLNMDWIHLNNDRDDVRDNQIHENFTDSANLRFEGATNTLANSVQFSENALPPMAAEIVAQAGVEPAWRDVLTLPDASVITEIDGRNLLKDGNRRYAYSPVSCAWRVVKPFELRAGKMLGTLGLTITNLSSTQRAEGQLDLAVYPDCTHTFLTANPGSYRLAPGATIEKRIEVEMPPGRYIIQTKSPLIGTCHSRLSVTIPCHLTRMAPIAAVEMVETRLQQQPLLQVRKADHTLAATLRFAVAGTDLALTAHLLEDRQQATDPVKSSLDVYAMLPGAAKITQILLHPPTATTPAQGLHQVGTDWPPTPEIRVTTRLTADGYDLSALIPLSMLGITPDAKEFMLESMVSAYQPGTDTYTYPALFHSVSAFMKSDLFAHVVVE